MSQPTFKTIEQVQFFKDKDCTIKYGDTKHDLRVFPKSKAQVINSMGGVFGMAYKSNKNNINKVVTCHGKVSEYFYSLIVEGVTCYFKMIDVNLYDFKNIK